MAAEWQAGDRREHPGFEAAAQRDAAPPLARLRRFNPLGAVSPPPDRRRGGSGDGSHPRRCPPPPQQPPLRGSSEDYGGTRGMRAPAVVVVVGGARTHPAGEGRGGAGALCRRGRRGGGMTS